MIEIPAGKVREYENIFDGLRREIWEETELKVTDKLLKEELYEYKNDASCVYSNGKI